MSNIVSVQVHADRSTVGAYRPDGKSIKHLVCINIQPDIAIWLTNAQAIVLAGTLRELTSEVSV